MDMIIEMMDEEDELFDDLKPENLVWLKEKDIYNTIVHILYL